MLIILKLIVFFSGTLILINMIKAYFIEKNFNTILYPAVAVYFFLYLPIFFDVIIGRPQYRSLNYGFIVSGEDFLTEIIYLFIISYILITLRSFQKRKVFTNSLTSNSTFSNVSFIILILIFTIIIVPIILDTDLIKVILSYNIFYYEGEKFNNIKLYGQLIIFACLFVLFLEKRRNYLLMKCIAILPIVTFSFLMNGKRNTVFIFFVGLLYIFISNKIFKRISSYIIFITATIIFLFTFSSFYQDYFDRVSGEDFEVSYTSFRINYGRDDTLKMVTYSEIYDDNKIEILDHRGQSALFYPLFFVKREVYSGKPYPYAVYFTNAMIGSKDTQLLGWGMTTSIFDELFSNFGWIGIILSPYFLIFLCNLGMKNSSGLLGNGITIISLFLALLAVAVELTAFLSLYILLFIGIILYKIKLKIRLT